MYEFLNSEKFIFYLQHFIRHIYEDMFGDSDIEMIEWCFCKVDKYLKLNFFEYIFDEVSQM